MYSLLMPSEKQCISHILLLLIPYHRQPQILMAYTNKHVFLAHGFGFGIWTKIKWKNQNCPFIQQLIMLKKKCKIMPQDKIGLSPCGAPS